MSSRALATGILAVLTAGLVASLTYHLVRKPEASPPTPTALTRAVTSDPLTSEPPICQNFYRSICQKTGVTRDPTGSVQPDVFGEIEALRLYRKIIQAHPDGTRDQWNEELVKTIYTEKRRKRVESAFRWVRGSIERLIEAQPEPNFNQREKKQILGQLRRMELQLPPPASVYADEPELFTKNDVYYERRSDGKTRMRVGGAYLFTAKSWFNLVFTIAHEFAHAIDPCEVRGVNLSFPAYDRLSACFIKSGLVAVHQGRSECGENDQLSETFADWIAVKIVGEALRTYATEFHGHQLVNAATNAVRDLCEQDEGITGNVIDIDFHPPPQIRIERIFGNNPEIRGALGCSVADPALPPSCDFDFAVPPTETLLNQGTAHDHPPSN